MAAGSFFEVWSWCLPSKCLKAELQVCSDTGYRYRKAALGMYRFLLIADEFTSADRPSLNCDSATLGALSSITISIARKLGGKLLWMMTSLISVFITREMLFERRYVNRSKIRQGQEAGPKVHAGSARGTNAIPRCGLGAYGSVLQDLTNGHRPILLLASIVTSIRRFRALIVFVEFQIKRI